MRCPRSASKRACLALMRERPWDFYYALPLFPPTLLDTAAAAHARERAALSPLGRAASAVALARAF
eukprot:6212492-Pleurochrysis_carterae.AAC.1